MSILEKIEAAKALAALKGKPTEVKTKIQEIESQMEQKLSQIASGEVKGQKLGGVVQSLKSLEKKQMELQEELNQVSAKVRESRALLNPAAVNSAKITAQQYVGVEKRATMLPNDKMFTTKDVMEIFGLSRPGTFHFMQRALSAGLIEVKIQGKMGRHNPTYYAKTGKQLPSEKMMEERNARLEMERKIAKLEPHPLLTNLDAKPYTFDQIKTHLSAVTGLKSPVVLAKKINELQESGHLRRFVEREKVLFVKN